MLSELSVMLAKSKTGSTLLPRLLRNMVGSITWSVMQLSLLEEENSWKLKKVMFKNYGT